MISTEEFIKRAKKVHGDKYDYSKVEYKHSKEKICIICPEHGEFWQTPNSHLNGRGCKKCKTCDDRNRHALGTNGFIERAKVIHGNKYDYSKVEYANMDIPVIIICKKHGEFTQRPLNHLQGYGCKLCGEEKRIANSFLTTSEFVERAKMIHGNKYDYSNVKYIGNRNKVKVICPVHGEFLQTPNSHLCGHGCPKCNASKLENIIKNELLKNGITFEEQKKIEWLGKQSLDFYLPDYNIAIECQGKQHFEPIKHFGGEKRFNADVIRDKKKLTLCREHNLLLLYFSNEKHNGTLNEKEIISEILCHRKK